MYRISCALVLVACSYLSFAAEKPASSLPAGSKMFIAPMEGGLNGFIATEVLKQKLPVSITTDDTGADFVLTGASLKADDKWYNTVFGGKDKNEGNVQLLSVRNKTVVWAGEAGESLTLVRRVQAGRRAQSCRPDSEFGEERRVSYVRVQTSEVEALRRF